MQIFKNGKIHSFNSENAIYEAIAVENGRIAALGIQKMYWKSLRKEMIKK